MIATMDWIETAVRLPEAIVGDTISAIVLCYWEDFENDLPMAYEIGYYDHEEKDWFLADGGVGFDAHPSHWTHIIPPERAKR